MLDPLEPVKHSKREDYKSLINFTIQTFITAATPSSSGLDLSTPGRWYVNIDGAVVDEYTRKQDVKNETADELNSRMEELEEKANEMQEQTNARLQQISVLLEKAMQHRSVVTIGDGQKQ